MIDWDMPSNEEGPLPSAPARSHAPGDLRPIPFEAFSVTPLPETWESDTEFAWLEFDAATVSMDLATQTGRAEYAELMNAQSARRPRA